MRCSTLAGSRFLISLFAVAIFQSSSVSAFEQCYYPDGSIPTDYFWVPCTGSTYSSCCVPSEGDICQPNGLCWFPDYGQVYRGTCTDRTWNDPACPSNICVTGFETTWTWAFECDGAGGSKSIACGQIDSYGAHATPTCPAHESTLSTGFITTRSTSSAGRYTPPPSVDPSIYSVYTSSYTTIVTANVQTTTFTTTFASTFTSKFAKAVATTTSGASASTSSGTTSSKSGGVALSTGTLIAVVVGAILLIAIGLGVFFFLRKRKSAKEPEAIRLGSRDHPPANGPVGADQVNPYEVPSNEVSSLPQKHVYTAPKVDTFEIDGRTEMQREKKNASTMEMSADDHESLRSPAPMYNEAWAPVELDATPVVRSPNSPYGRY